MPTGDNPKSRANLRVPTSKEARKNGAKGGKASGQARRNYASLRECFKQRMTDEMKEQAFDKLWQLFIKNNNLNAYDRLVDGLGEEQTEGVMVAGIVQLPKQEFVEGGDER